MTTPGAIAIFVKTPELSPVKTRLAAEVGVAEAEAFYRLCVAATKAVVRRAAERVDLVAYWAVAEPDAVDHPLWTSFSRTYQGTGGLGHRLDRVYRTLLDRHPFVLLVGADAPLLSPDVVRRAVEVVQSERAAFAISRSSDGGYALFAGRRPLPAEAWTTVPYSSSDTAAVFLDRVRPHGNVAELSGVDDVDTLDDLIRLVSHGVGELPEQAAVVEYARMLLGQASANG